MISLVAVVNDRLLLKHTSALLIVIIRLLSKRKFDLQGMDDAASSPAEPQSTPDAKKAKTSEASGLDRRVASLKRESSLQQQQRSSTLESGRLLLTQEALLPPPAQGVGFLDQSFLERFVVFEIYYSCCEASIVLCWRRLSCNFGSHFQQRSKPGGAAARAPLCKGPDRRAAHW